MLWVIDFRLSDRMSEIVTLLMFIHQPHKSWYTCLDYCDEAYEHTFSINIVIY
jgi:hypothetical protein